MSIVNAQSVNLLRWSALALGAWWGFSRHHSLVRTVKDRNEDRHQAQLDELISEAKIAYEAHYNRTQAALARQAGIKAIDSNSIYFDANAWLDWATAQQEQEQKK